MFKKHEYYQNVNFIDLIIFLWGMFYFRIAIELYMNKWFVKDCLQYRTAERMFDSSFWL